VVHIKEIEYGEKTVLKLAKGVQILVGILVLGNEGADDGGGRQNKEHKNRQLNRGKKFQKAVEGLGERPVVFHADSFQSKIKPGIHIRSPMPAQPKLKP
jgi:hypothetical protein